jgi:TonB family protein
LRNENAHPKVISEAESAGLLCGSSLRESSNPDYVRIEKSRSDGGRPLCGPIQPPVYPAEAKRQGIEGAVHLEAVIGVDGTVKLLRAIDGHPMLVPAAIDAVKRWQYKPYYADGKPVDVQTTITVNFKIAK